MRNLAEIIVEFIENQIVMPTIGKEGLRVDAVPAVSLFIFIYLCNVPGIIPIIQMPATARIAIPLFLCAARLGDLHRRRLQAPGLGYFTAPAVAARRARRR